MSIMEEVGLSREDFDILYEQNGGFNAQFNKNHPIRGQEESVYSYLKEGVKSLVTENTDLVRNVAEAAGFGNGNC